jgi:hypothetical protein
MVRRALLVMILFFSAAANATDFSDIWFDPAESGWGVNVVQSDTFQFLTFFIYGQDGNPTWYTAHLTNDGTGNYSGALYATSGTYFAVPWQGVAATVVGSASFQPTTDYNATLTYTFTGGPTVTKPIQRQTLTAYQMSGSYSGSVSGSISGCVDPTNNLAVLRHRVDLTVTQTGDDSAVLSFTLFENSAVCTFSGPLTHIGRMYQMTGAQYVCGSNPPITANVDDLDLTNQGIEGRWTSDDGGGCTESIRFGTVLN